MKLSLQSYFDIGASYGLGDDIFRQSPSVAVPDIAQIGIRNPLGQGIVHRVGPKLLSEWVAAAARKVDVPEMELGYAGSQSATAQETEADFSQFRERLREYILKQPIDSCDLTVYAIGIVFVRFDFSGGLPLEFLKGFGRCFEYAAYQPHISGALHQAAKQTVEVATRKQYTGMQNLSKRPEPEIQEDDRGNRESKLFSSFLPVVLCVDEEDDVEAVKRQMLPPDPASHQPQYKALPFEYHGVLYFDWASCVLVPRSFDDPDEPPSAQIQRMLHCIQIANTFFGTCEAFENLFFHETLRQADGYIKGKPGGRDPKELNRLRTLALAVVSLTSYASVAVAEEDQSYFESFERHAKIKERHRVIQERCEILHNVQVAETQADEVERENLLNRVILFLTAFTFLSVFADSYAFLEKEDKWLPLLLNRLALLGAIVGLIILVIVAVLRWSSRRNRNRRV